MRLKFIENEAQRLITFRKRMVGLMKKALEISLLCGIDVGFVAFREGKMHVCSNTSIRDVVQRYNEYQGAYQTVSMESYDDLRPERFRSSQTFPTAYKNQTPCTCLSKTIPSMTTHVCTTEPNPGATEKQMNPTLIVDSCSTSTKDISNHATLCAPPSLLKHSPSLRKRARRMNTSLRNSTQFKSEPGHQHHVRNDTRHNAGERSEVLQRCVTMGMESTERNGSGQWDDTGLNSENFGAIHGRQYQENGDMKKVHLLEIPHYNLYEGSIDPPSTRNILADSRNVNQAPTSAEVTNDYHPTRVSVPSTGEPTAGNDSRIYHEFKRRCSQTERQFSARQQAGSKQVAKDMLRAADNPWENLTAPNLSALAMIQGESPRCIEAARHLAQICASTSQDV
mmetsp:Transcript_22995/g.36138  ORF Transcript_22995/g.36138 Transcript_22995/m.36138 type:complete len:395 (-) Transcript_22995:94-1278(-)